MHRVAMYPYILVPNPTKNHQKVSSFAIPDPLGSYVPEAWLPQPQLPLFWFPCSLPLVMTDRLTLSLPLFLLSIWCIMVVMIKESKSKLRLDWNKHVWSTSCVRIHNVWQSYIMYSDHALCMEQNKEIRMIQSQTYGNMINAIAMISIISSRGNTSAIL